MLKKSRSRHGRTIRMSSSHKRRTKRRVTASEWQDLICCRWVNAFRYLPSVDSQPFQSLISESPVQITGMFQARIQDIISSSEQGRAAGNPDW